MSNLCSLMVVFEVIIEGSYFLPDIFSPISGHGLASRAGAAVPFYFFEDA